jgi:glycosyltransferase involved in cell wall biosynthesis
MSDNGQSLSVILPVRNHGDQALRCIRSLQRMEPPEGVPLELIVVNNGSTDGTRNRLARVDGIRLLDEPRPGSYVARNCGAMAAGGSLLAFTDSDCEVDPGWARALVAALASADVDAVQGHTVGRPGSTVWSVYCGRQYAGTSGRMAGADRLDRADTRNLAVRTAVFRQLGGFREAWTHAADWEFGARLHHRGCRLVSAPAMRAAHHDPERLEAILDTRRRQATCMADMADTLPWLREGGYLGPANRWYHGGRRVPVLRSLIGALLRTGESAAVAWLERFHASGPSAAGYALYRAAGALAGMGGLYTRRPPAGTER